jgi:hypothetical protein
MVLCLFMQFLVIVQRKRGSWRAITVQMKDRRGLSDKQGSPGDNGSHIGPMMG